MFELSTIPETPGHLVGIITRVTLLFHSGPLLALLVAFPCLALPASSWSSESHRPRFDRMLKAPTIEVETRLRRLEAIPSMPECARWDCEREIWNDFRSHAEHWFPPLARHALCETDPLREEAIIALRCFGTEQPWEHAEHGERKTPCLLGFERRREQAESLLSEIATRERGRTRQYALLSLACYRTGSATRLLMEHLREDENCELVDEALRWIVGGTGTPSAAPDPFCGAGPADPPMRAEKVKRWQAWWKGVLDGKNEFPGSGTLADDRRPWK